MQHPIVHWEIGAKDTRRMQEFYGQLFGWQINNFGPDYAMVSSGGADKTGIDGGMRQVGADPNERPYLTVYVQVDDLAAALSKAQTLGATALVPPTDIPGGASFAMFLDPEGRCIGLYKPQA